MLIDKLHCVVYFNFFFWPISYSTNDIHFTEQLHVCTENFVHVSHEVLYFIGYGMLHEHASVLIAMGITDLIDLNFF